MRARITIAGVTWSVHRCRVPRTIHGDGDYSRRRIRVSSRLSGREFADTLIHELIHARWPDLSEEALADDLAALDDVLLNVENHDERIAICNSWLTALADRLGYNLVTLSPLDGWDSMDPAAEMVAMKSEAH